MNRKKPSEMKRMSDRVLARLALDLRDELALVQAQLSLAKREQRARKQGRSKAKRSLEACGTRAALEPAWVSTSVH